MGTVVRRLTQMILTEIVIAVIKETTKSKK